MHNATRLGREEEPTCGKVNRDRNTAKREEKKEREKEKKGTEWMKRRDGTWWWKKGQKKEYEEEDADENRANDSLMKAEAEGRLEFRQRPGFFYVVPSTGRIGCF
ncbi:hypothetical protein K0M31_015492 [Melipona bicolor]|uniref:Uncharacterized protein n=1 Tax=Melipona bicolor TaxID=60889 RepID=A0AA40FGF6_9HYME|nr:hypothetical protein K0M31_015492 [Melipona bicolor]